MNFKEDDVNKKLCKHQEGKLFFKKNSSMIFKINFVAGSVCSKKKYGDEKDREKIQQLTKLLTWRMILQITNDGKAERSPSSFYMTFEDFAIFILVSD